MKPSSLMVITADQRRSRSGPDLVPDALRALADLPGQVLSFERTAGDEVQGLMGSAESVVEATARLARLGGWRMGLGLGPVEQPLPRSTREARGAAYLAARDAVERARTVPAQLRLVSVPELVGPGTYDRCEAVETVLWLLSTLWRRRSRQGWEVAELLEDQTVTSAAAQLGVSASAVSQRSTAAHLLEERRGRALAVSLLRELGMAP